MQPLLIIVNTVSSDNYTLEYAQCIWSYSYRKFLNACPHTSVATHVAIIMILHSLLYLNRNGPSKEVHYETVTSK